jgi:transporter family protein
LWGQGAPERSSQRYIYRLAIAIQMELLWLPFSLATIFFCGIGQVFAKETRAKVPSSTLLLILGGNMFAMWTVYWFFFRQPGPFSLEVWLQAAIGAALSGLAYLTYYESLKHGKVSIVGTIAGAYGPWTVVLAVTFLGESMSLGEAAGVSLVVAAMLIFAYSTNGESQRRTELVGIAFATASLFFWGTSAVIAKGAIDKIGNANFLGLFGIIGPAIWVVYWLASDKGRIEMPEANKRILELSMLFLAAGGITLYLAIQNGNVSIVSPITNLYPLLTIAVAKVRLKEKLSGRQMIALAMLLVSIPLFSF